MAGLGGELAELETGIQESQQVALVLEESHHCLEEEACEVYWRLRGWPVGGVGFSGVNVGGTFFD
jgi:hypothetical protein